MGAFISLKESKYFSLVWIADRVRTLGRRKRLNRASSERKNDSAALWA
jgi:hypothetical protein